MSNAESVDRPKIGDGVHYIGVNGNHYPAIITNAHIDKRDNTIVSIDVLVFATDGNEYVSPVYDVEYLNPKDEDLDEEALFGSWHWPELI